MPDWILEPWPWYTSGIIISCVMFALLFFGERFGFSSNLRTICAAAGAGKQAKFFDYDWRKHLWNLLFLAGAIIGGFIASHYLQNGQPVAISEQTINDISKMGFSRPLHSQPDELFSIETLCTFKGFALLALGGLLIGFGTRWAGGCTSGHAISGLSDLQIPSLIAVIGFFAGGLIMTHFILPVLF